MREKLQQLLRDGEGLTTEFKRCKSELSNSVYETVASFSNRYGGYILLGVEDDGTVPGVNRENISKIKKDFANTLNNPQRFSPTLFLPLEAKVIDDRTVLWCYVPPNSQVVMFGAKFLTGQKMATLTLPAIRSWSLISTSAKWRIIRKEEFIPMPRQKTLRLNG